MKRPAFFWPAVVLIASGSLAAGCGDEGGVSEPDINPGLLEAANTASLAADGALPQGAAPFAGPAGLAMDATAEEFIQQLTFADGTVWRTSGITVRAVPDEAVTGSPIDYLSFSSANTGSLASVPPGTYTISGTWPEIDFINQVKLSAASIRQPGSRDAIYATSGTFTIQGVNYFNDVYTCSLNFASGTVTVDECYYQIGVLRGVVEFTVPLADGTGPVVQPRTEFALPIMRRTIKVRSK
jgi:hypothetical protein